MTIPLPQRTPCPFCEYIAGSRPWAIIFRNTLIASFVNIRQYTKGAILIIPLRHAPTIFELTREELCAIGQHAQEVTYALQHVYQPTGYNIFQNNGLVAGQSIPHYHLHIVPRYGGEEPNKIFGAQDIEKTPLDQQLVIAEKVKQQLRTSAWPAPA
jgi:histidine triad (HIT) family protein